MADPFGFLNFVAELVQDASIFSSIAFWTVISGIAPIFIMFLFMAIGYSKIQSGLWCGDSVKPSPFGLLGPLFGLPAVIPKNRAEIMADRKHSYKRWGTILCSACIAGGLFLFVIGATQPVDIENQVLGKLTNVTPGTVLFLIGLKIWTSVHN